MPTLKNSVIVQPKIILNVSIVGNVKLPHSKRGAFKKFLTTQSEKSFLVLELGKSGDNPHIHFFIETYGNQLTTLKKNIRTAFPELKNSKKGGDKKYHASYIKDKIQYFYLFKESPCKVPFTGSWQLMSDYFVFTFNKVKELKTSYFEELGKRQNGAAAKFLLYCETYTLIKLSHISIKKLILLYIDYSILNNRKILTSFDCQKHINYVLAHKQKSLFLQYLNSVLEHSYF